MSGGGLGSSGVVPTIRSGGRRFLDPYRRDDYKQNGTLEFPFKTVNAAVANIPAPLAEDIEQILLDPTASKEGICELSLCPGHYGDIEIDRPCVVSGSIGSYVTADTIVIGGLIGIVVLRNITAASLTMTSAGIVILIECNIANITSEHGEANMVLVASDVSDTLDFTGQYLAISRDSTINDLTVTADGQSLSIGVKGSTINNAIVGNNTDGETISWTFVNSWTNATYEAAAFESITNVNSVLPNFDVSGADNYQLLVAGPEGA